MAKRESDLKERIATLENAHHKQVHHKVCRGDLPVKRRRSDSINVRPWRGRYSPPDPPVIEDQWCDTVEELDQTHADRRLELANELTQLARFTVYCRTSAGQHHVALPQTAETALDKEQIERI